MSENVVKLNWITTSETNNNYFTIERTADGSYFEVVDYLSGAGNSSMPLYYNSMDENPLKGLSFYRLKQTDYDGRFAYSKLVAVDSDEQSDDLEIVFFSAVPDNRLLVYQIAGAYKQELYVELFDIMGKAIRSETIASGGDNKGFRMDVSNLNTGVYMFRVTDGEHVALKKFFY